MDFTIYCFSCHLAQGPFEAMLFEGSTMVGMGTTPEGIEQNDIMYNFFNSLTFRDDILNVTDW